MARSQRASRGSTHNRSSRATKPLALLLGIGCLFAMAIVARPELVAARRGWLTSSGGVDAYDPFAQAGTGDGDALVGAEEDAASVAPIADTNVFLSTDSPSLYDVFNDMYGEPFRPKETERAVPLPADLSQREERQISVAKQAGREFSAVRKPPTPTSVSDSESDAVLHLEGRTPAHLRLCAFDVFDGRAWYPAQEPEHPPRLVMQTHDGAPWLWLGWRALPSGEPTAERHRLRVLSLDTACVPLLAQTTHLAIDQVDDAGFFQWRQDGLVGLQGRKCLPPLTVVELASDFGQAEMPYRALEPAKADSRASLERSISACSNRDRLEALARQWTAGCRSPAEQVAAVVRHLREACRHDRGQAATEQTRDVVDEFLFRTRCGPDYLFATSAAVLLRALGFRTRLVSGFYASPERYDLRSGLTPVLPDDVHVWSEVRGDLGSWIPIEPTPGYELLAPRLSWGPWCRMVASSLAARARRQALVLAAIGGAVVFVFANRWRIADVASGSIWRLAVGCRPESAPYITWRVLDWRCRRAGLQKPAGATIAQWLDRLSIAKSCSGRALEQFLADLSQSLYGPPARGERGPDTAAAGFRIDHHGYRQIMSACRIRTMRVRAKERGRGVRSHWGAASTDLRGER